MNDRKPNRWTVKLQAATGQTSTVEVQAHWGTAFKGVEVLVGQAAAIRAWYNSSKDPHQRVNFAALSVEPVQT